MVDENVEVRPKPSPNWLKSQVSRRGFFKTFAGGAVAGAAAGFAAGREVEYRHENPDDVTDEPLEIQIRKLELRGKQTILKDENLRSLYIWLITSWYGYNHSFGIFADPQDERAVASRIYSSISFIEDKKDSRLEGSENFAGWTYPQDSIFLNLTSTEFDEDYTYNTTGGAITPPMRMRDSLVHEMTHFITTPREEAQIIDIVRKSRLELTGINAIAITGFSMVFDPDPSNPDVSIIQHLDDFDEASTELIANYYQRAAGLAIGLPNYPEENQTELDQSRIEKTLDALEATLKLSGITIDQFAELHANSDLDGLAKALADCTNRAFKDDLEKIEYGLSIITALKNLDRKTIGEHIQSIKL